MIKAKLINIKYSKCYLRMFALMWRRLLRRCTKCSGGIEKSLRTVEKRFGLETCDGCAQLIEMLTCGDSAYQQCIVATVVMFWTMVILHCCYWLGWLKCHRRWDLVFAIGFLRYWDGWSCQMTKRSFFGRHCVAELCVLDSWKFGQNIIETVTVFNGWCYT